MCRMCEWKGQGTIWYKNPANYANRLYKKREPGKTTQYFGGTEALIGRLHEAIQAKADGDIETFQKLIRQINEHDASRPGGQVLPLSDAQEVLLDIGMPVAAMHCICRKTTRGEEERTIEEYSCLGLGTGMFKWERWPERYRGGVHFLTPRQAAEFLEYWDRRGMVHTIMYEGGSFIGGLCNCDYPDCIPLRQRLDYGLTHQLAKAEYICEVDYERCNGCGECLGRCQFGALRYESTFGMPNIDATNCFGCALCLTACRRDAIALVPRSRYPALRGAW